jgi:hypothetical protein
MCNAIPPPHSGGGYNICVEEPAGIPGENFGLHSLMVIEIKHNYLLSMIILSITRIKHNAN